MVNGPPWEGAFTLLLDSLIGPTVAVRELALGNVLLITPTLLWTPSSHPQQLTSLIFCTSFHDR